MKACHVKRYDLTDLKIGKNVRETAQGFLEITARTARTGIQSYRLPDGSTLDEFRPESEVFSESALESMRTSVVTDGHPDEMVDPENVKDLQVGFPQGEIKKVEDEGEFFTETKLIITHKKGIDAIRAGKVQLSHGYGVDLEFEPGEHKGRNFDAVQRNIINNHIALVWNARAGEKASLRLDSKDAILVNEKPKNEKKETNPMKMVKIKVGDSEIEVPEDSAKVIEDQRNKEKSEHDSKLKEANDRADGLQDQVDGLKQTKSRLNAKVDSLEDELEKKKTPKLDGEELDKKVNERIKVLDTGKRLLSKEQVKELDKMNNKEIKKEVIKAASSGKVDESKLDDQVYLDSRFDMVVENMDSSDNKTSRIGEGVINGRQQVAKDDGDEYVSPDEMRKRRMDEQMYGSDDDDK